jgi:predicted phosphodiesterase
VARVAVFADVHGNLPALQAALAEIRLLGCEATYCLGDAIAIGPQPAECLDLLLDTPNIYPTMGNHELWYVDGLPQPRPEWMSDGEVVHQQWVHAQLGPRHRSAIKGWSNVLEEEVEGVRLALMHYPPADTPSGYVGSIHRPSAEELDWLFCDYPADVVCYGHTHVAWQRTGQNTTYVNPGALGCDPEPLARFVTVECLAGKYVLEDHAVPYDDEPLYRAFGERLVPEREFLYRAFFGGRFPRA